MFKIKFLFKQFIYITYTICQSAQSPYISGNSFLPNPAFMHHEYRYNKYYIVTKK